ncbi:type I-E CRISPR-associated protein Cas7/Cse4/CasC [Escherichia coli]|nr:type I-E CRISPR-associated protein Cas7/Cse4/CasC [Escherichia coli]
MQPMLFICWQQRSLGAKQRTYAAFNPADMVMVNFSDMPLSMANAFEKAVKANDGFFATVFTGV